MRRRRRVIPIRTLDEFDRELGRDGGETLEVPARLAAEYGLFAEDVGGEDEIRDAGADPHGPGERERR